MINPTINQNMVETAPLSLHQTKAIPIYSISVLDTYPNIVQGIFTRLGGVSKAPYQSLNLSLAVGDSAQAVEKNHQLMYQAVSVDPIHTSTCHLVHGVQVLMVTQANQQPMMGYADGLITTTPNIYLTMRFADCVPLLFVDPVQQVVGVAHAGWRGTMQQMATVMVETLVDLGCQPKNIIAIIGPSIGPCCYEVGTEVIETAQQTLPKANQLFQRHQTNNAHFDLWLANRQQLEAANVGTIISTNLCTACHTDKFFSHRAEQGHTGRFGVIIGLRLPIS